MTNFQLPMFRKPSEDTCEKTSSATICNVCFVAWLSVGLLIIAGLVLKLIGLI